MCDHNRGIEYDMNSYHGFLSSEFSGTDITPLEVVIFLQESSWMVWYM